jgi:hypothetical protein
MFVHGRGFDVERAVENDDDHVVRKGIDGHPAPGRSRGGLFQWQVAVVRKEVQALRGRMSLVFWPSHCGEEVDVFEGVWLLRDWIDHAMGRGHHQRRRDERTRAIKAGPVSRNIDLADRIPRGAALIQPNPIVVADDSRAQILAQGGSGCENDGQADEYLQRHTYHHGASLPVKCGGRVKSYLGCFCIMC